MPDHHDHDQLQRAAAARTRITEVAAVDAFAEGAPERIVVDVREPHEYDADHLEGAVNIPLDQLPQRLNSVLPDADTPVITYCNGGNRGALGADTLRDLGYTDVVNLAGGLRSVREQHDE